MARSVLVPLPDRDFDVTEVAVPWKLLSERGVDIVFATEEGAAPRPMRMKAKRGIPVSVGWDA